MYRRCGFTIRILEMLNKLMENDRVWARGLIHSYNIYEPQINISTLICLGCKKLLFKLISKIDRNFNNNLHIIYISICSTDMFRRWMSNTEYLKISAYSYYMIFPLMLNNEQLSDWAAKLDRHRCKYIFRQTACQPNQTEHLIYFNTTNTINNLDVHYCSYLATSTSSHYPRCWCRFPFMLKLLSTKILRAQRCQNFKVEE